MKPNPPKKVACVTLWCCSLFKKTTERCPILLFICLLSASISLQASSVFPSRVWLVPETNPGSLYHKFLFVSSFSCEALQLWSSARIHRSAVQSVYFMSHDVRTAHPSFPHMIVSEQFCLIVLILRAGRTLTHLLIPLISKCLHLDPPMQQVLSEEGRMTDFKSYFFFFHITGLICIKVMRSLTSCVSLRVKKGFRYLASSHRKPFKSCLWKIWASYSSSVSSDKCSDSMALPWKRERERVRHVFSVPKPLSYSSDLTSSSQLAQGSCVFKLGVVCFFHLKLNKLCEQP